MRLLGGHMAVSVNLGVLLVGALTTRALQLGVSTTAQLPYSLRASSQ